MFLTMATLKQIQDLLTKKMRNAEELADGIKQFNVKGLSDYSYYSGIAEGYRKAKGIIGKLNKD